MKQIVQIDEQLKSSILELESACEQICLRLTEKYRKYFSSLSLHLTMEFVRQRKGRRATKDETFKAPYESYIEIGFESESVYYANAYIPIWKCKDDLFQLIGYITECQISEISCQAERILLDILKEEKSKRK
ncbi:hypothetical protein J9303_19370 [Bacillaceae bacterium Marseille-Q3522]|nr:hypothetical protein [Bacillaceae bacterium Marseille-Q3522]